MPLCQVIGKRQCLPTDWLKGNVIGSGSFGTVHLAIDMTTGSLFVVKSAISEAGIVSLKNEANLLENLDSPHIIKCMGKDVSNNETKYSLFFEHMGGGSLSDLVQKFGGTLHEKVVRLYTRQILLGLKYLHSKRIVHCDIKCRNILLGASGAVKLADFGCGKRLIGDDDDGQRRSPRSWKGIGGTPLWMAPEVVRNEGLDFSADIWSLGCTVIEMATGKPAWRADVSNPMATMLRIATGDDVPDFPGHFSAEGRDFLVKCLERDPRKRLTSDQLLGHPFVAQMTCVRKEVASSPTSVLDLASYDDSDNDEAEDDEIASRIPRFSMKCCLEDKKCASENILEASSDSWITVRSRL